MRTKTVLTLEDCKIIMKACHAEAEKNGWKVAIAVVDDAGYLLHLERQDGASLQTAEIAQRKAFTASVGRNTTKVFEDLVKERPGLAWMPDRLPVQGGIPVVKDGEVVGGIGVSGVKSHEDEIVAEAGRKALLG